MGSNPHEPLSQEEEITVLVTGFGVCVPQNCRVPGCTPFRAQYPINPSWEIAKSLPPFLPPPTSPTADLSAIASNAPVRILVHPEPIKVAYKTVRELVPQLWEAKRIDYCIHIGMASGRRFYSVERRGHRDGYGMEDVDNELLGDHSRKKIEGDEWIWHGLPEILLSDADVDDVWRRWRIALPSTDVRISEDAGRYLCDFIYYSSMAHLTKKQEKRRVVFLHVPVDSNTEAIKTGIEVTLELIRALVQSGRVKKLGKKD